jgi:hypothetical protein
VWLGSSFLAGIKRQDMEKSGFTIVFGGPEFQPRRFVPESKLPTTVVLRGDVLRDGQVASESWVEFADIRNGTYPLDAAGEAFDFLASNREEFVRLSQFAGVVTRTLNFFGDGDSCSMEFEPADIALLHALSMRVSISVY